MKKLLIIILIIFPFLIYAQELHENIQLDEEYINLFLDLANTNTNGYKRHWLDGEFNWLDNDEKIKLGYTGSGGIDFSQGVLKFTNRQLDFTIDGDGFFKIIFDDGKIGYTRNGEFTIKGSTNELITIEGYELYDPIIIPPGFIELSINNNHEIVTEYSDGRIINNGVLNIYILDKKKLYYNKEKLFNSRNIFLYDGNIEEIGDGRILNGFIEHSNVDPVLTIVRIKEISMLMDIRRPFSKEQERLLIDLFLK